MTNADSVSGFEPVDLGEGLVLEPFSSRYQESFLECVARSFDCRPALERWLHLNFENPVGRSLILIVRDGERVVAGITHLRRRLSAFGRIYDVGHGMDAMTDPDYRLKGLRRSLTEALLRLDEEAGISLVCGVANDQVLASNLKYSGQAEVSGFPPIMVKPTRPASAAWRLLTRGLSSLVTDTATASGLAAPPDCAAAGPLALTDKERRRVERELATGRWVPAHFDDAHARLYANHIDAGRVCFMSDAASLRWRYAKTERTFYLQRDIVAGSTLLASMVARPATLRGVAFLVIMEFVWLEGERAQAMRLIDDAVQLGRSLRTHALSLLAMPSTAARELAAELGFRMVPKFLVGKGLHLTIGKTDLSGPPDPRLLEGDNWAYSWGNGFVL